LKLNGTQCCCYFQCETLYKRHPINIGVISEGSCDTKDWSNDAENTDLITGINHILTYSNRKQLFEVVIICHNITAFSVFWFK